MTAHSQCQGRASGPGAVMAFRLVPGHVEAPRLSSPTPGASRPQSPEHPLGRFFWCPRSCPAHLSSAAASWCCPGARPHTLGGRTASPGRRGDAGEPSPSGRHAPCRLGRPPPDGGRAGGRYRPAPGPTALRRPTVRPDPRLRARARTPAVPGVGQCLRRPQQRGHLVARTQGRSPLRRPGSAAGRRRRHRAGRRHPGLHRRRSLPSSPAGIRVRRRAPVERRGRCAPIRPPRCPERPGRRGQGRKPTVGRRGRHRVPRRPRTSSPRWSTARGRPGSSPPPDRERPGC